MTFGLYLTKQCKHRQHHSLAIVIFWIWHRRVRLAPLLLQKLKLCASFLWGRKFVSSILTWLLRPLITPYQLRLISYSLQKAFQEGQKTELTFENGRIWYVLYSGHPLYILFKSAFLKILSMWQYYGTEESSETAASVFWLRRKQNPSGVMWKAVRAG